MHFSVNRIKEGEDELILNYKEMNTSPVAERNLHDKKIQNR